MIDANRRIPALSPSASASACPSGEPDVLDRVVAVDLEVALRRHREVEPGVRAELLEHVVEEREAGVGARGARAVERRARRGCSVSFVVALHGGRSCASVDHAQDLLERGQEQVDLLGRAGGHAQALGHDVREVADEHARSSSACQTSRGGLRRAEQDEVRVATGTPSTPRSPGAPRGSDRARRGPPSRIVERLRRGGRSATSPGRLRERGQVVRQPDRLQVLRPRRPRRGSSRAARRPARTPSRTCAPRPRSGGRASERHARSRRRTRCRPRRRRRGLEPSAARSPTDLDRLRVAGRVVRRADEDDVGLAARRPASTSCARVRHEFVERVCDTTLGVRQPGEPRVQQVRRLEQRRRAGRARRRRAAAAWRISFEPFAAHVPSSGVADRARRGLAQLVRLCVRVAVERERRAPRGEIVARSRAGAGTGTRSCSGGPSTSSCGDTYGATSRRPGRGWRRSWLARRSPRAIRRPRAWPTSPSRPRDRGDLGRERRAAAWRPSRRPTSPSRSRRRGARSRSAPSPRWGGRGSRRRRSRRTGPADTGRRRSRRRSATAAQRTRRASSTISCRCSGARSSTASAACSRSRDQDRARVLQRGLDDLAPRRAGDLVPRAPARRFDRRIVECDERGCGVGVVLGLRDRGPRATQRGSASALATRTSSVGPASPSTPTTPLQLALRFGDVRVPRPDDLVDGRHRVRSERHRRDRLGAADLHDARGAGLLRGVEHRRGGRSRRSEAACTRRSPRPRPRTRERRSSRRELGYTARPPGT